MQIGPFRGQYAFLSNFSLVEVQFEGQVYPTVEHAFQAAKTLDLEKRAEIARLSCPGYAKGAGRRLRLRGDWEDVKLSVMETLLRKKFCNWRLRRMLLLTQDHELVEFNWWHDTFWGVCDGVGENHLGKLLMKIREECRQEVQAAT